jgi:acyl carrier protein
MTPENQQKVINIIANTLEVNADQVTPEIAVGSIPQWDSMAQLAIVSALEEAFSLTFDVDELFEVENVGDFIKLLDNQGI